MSRGGRRRPRLEPAERRLLALLAAVVVFVAGIAVGARPEAAGLDRLPDPLRRALLGSSDGELVDRAIAILEQRYYKPVDRASLRRGSLEGLLASLNDPYTGYLDPRQLRLERQRVEGVYVGVGIALGTRGPAVLVQRVYPRSPAARAGIRAGDHIRAVEGRALPAGGVRAAVARITGPAGSTVRLDVARAGAPPRTLTLRRERVVVPVVRARLVRRAGRAVGVVDLLAFTADASRSVRSNVSALRTRGAQALVLDLRGDPGGLLDQAIAVAAVFLPKGSPVAITEGAHEARRTLRTNGSPAAGGLPLVVLVDRASASASEVLAGALRDEGRATLIGSRTFGKALVQTTVGLPNGGALKLTIARYLTPRGQDLQDVGLTPSVQVVDDPATAPDEALEQALAVAGRRG